MLSVYFYTWNHEIIKVRSSPKGGLPSLRHNEIRDLTATLLTEVCSQVCVEPELQPVQHSDEFPLATSNTQDSACLDVAVNSIWGGRSERCFIDVRVFNPFAPSNSSSSLSSTFRKHEKIKHRAYGQRVREVEHATFTPIVMCLFFVLVCSVWGARLQAVPFVYPCL